jgi:hypothetical protein
LSEGPTQHSTTESTSRLTAQSPSWQIRLLPAITGIAGLIMGGVLVGVTGSRSTDPTHGRASRSLPSLPTATAPAPSTPLPAAPTTVVTTVSMTVTVSSQPLADLGDGTYVVPSQAQPGTWSTDGRSQISATLLGCYWARLRSLSGEPKSVIASDNLAMGAPTTITVAATDKAVKFSGGCRWNRIA